ncbi:helix-turn-helix domain-containing protein [Eubacteriaceae bacterium ES2]|nr:helix-turn-helix domain-containing protein [Eubacteriaceae bacterium ES2]
MNLNLDIIFYELSKTYACVQNKHITPTSKIGYPSICPPNLTFCQDEVLYVCDASEIPTACTRGFFVCSGKTDISDPNTELFVISVENTTCLALFDSLIAIFKKYNNWDRLLQKALNLKNPLKALACYSRNILINPFCVADADFRLIVPVYENIEKYNNDNFSPPDEEGYIQFEHVNYYKNDPKHLAICNVKGMFFYKSDLLPYQCFGINFFRENDAVARIMLFEVNSIFSKIDQFLLEHLALYMQPCFSLAVSQTSPDSRGFHNFVLSILEEETSKSVTDSSLSPPNWKTSDLFLWLHLLQSEKDISTKTTNYMCIKIEKYFSQSCAIKWEKGISILINLTAAKLSEEIFIQKFEVFVNDNSYQAGISNTFNGHENIRDFHIQATIAALTGKSIHPEKKLYKFTDYAVTYFLKNGVKTFTSVVFCHPVVQTLSKYDAENDSDYVITLKTYLENQMGILATANELAVHRSTMIYRLKRIETLTEIDWNNNEEIFYILFSLRMISEGLVAF